MGSSAHMPHKKVNSKINIFFYLKGGVMITTETFFVWLVLSGKFSNDWCYSGLSQLVFSGGLDVIAALVVDIVLDIMSNLE